MVQARGQGRKAVVVVEEEDVALSLFGPCVQCGGSLRVINRKITMSSAEHLKQLVRKRLSDVAEEIFAVFHKAMLDYEEELERYRKYFGAATKPVVMLRRIGQWRL